MNTVDMMIHVRPALDAQARANLERNLMEHAGVDCAEFRDESHLHSLMVTYDPEAVKRVEILDVVRETDPDAITVGC
jgi:ABC-type sulfate/molybdate transport systems ATPase subunit